ncbi:MAG: hypothetical protein J5755_04430, partial [Clostridia bacterium]|nr:hypothetical protein [Clostridia bacterium]
NEVPLKSLLNNLLAGLLNVGTADADENNNNNTLVMIGQVLNLMAGITLGKQEIDVHFATDLLRQAVALAGLDLDLKDVDGDESYIRYYNSLIDDDVTETKTFEWLGRDVDADDRITEYEKLLSAALTIVKDKEYGNLTLYTPIVDFDGELQYETSLEQYSTITDMEMLHFELSGAIGVDGQGGSIELGKLISGQGEGTLGTLIGAMENSTTVFTVDEVVQSINFDIEANLGLRTENFAAITEGNMTVAEVVKALVQELTLYVKLSRTLAGVETTFAEAFYMSNYVYLDLSGLGLPKIAMELHIDDILGLLFGDDATAMAAEPVDRSKALEIILDPNKLILQASSAFIANLLDKMGYHLNTVVDIRAEVLGDKLFSFDLTATDEANLTTRFFLDVNKPVLELGGRLSKTISDTSEYGYLSDLEYVYVTGTLDLSFALNKSDPTQYILTDLLNDVFGAETIPFVVENDMARSLTATLALNLGLKDLGASELYIYLANDEGELLTLFYDGGGYLYVSAPMFGDGLSLRIEFDIVELLSSTNIAATLASLDVQQMIYDLLGLTNPAHAHANAEEEEEELDILGLVTAVLANVNLSDKGVFDFFVNKYIFQNLGVDLINTDFMIENLKELHFAADLLLHNIMLDVVLNHKEEGQSDPYLSISIHDYNIRATKQTIAFDGSRFNTTDDYDHVYVSALGIVDYSFADGRYDFGGLIESIVEDCYIPVDLLGINGSFYVNLQAQIGVVDIYSSEFLLDVYYRNASNVETHLFAGIYLDIKNRELYVDLPWFEVDKLLITGLDVEAIIRSLFGATAAAEEEPAWKSIARTVAKCIDYIFVADGSSTYDEGIYLMLNENLLATVLDAVLPSLKISLPFSLRPAADARSYVGLSVSERRVRMDFELANTSATANPATDVGYLRINFSFNPDDAIVLGGNNIVPGVKLADTSIRPQRTQDSSIVYTTLLDLGMPKGDQLVLENLYLTLGLSLKADLVSGELNLQKALQYLMNEKIRLVVDEADQGVDYEIQLDIELEANLNLHDLWSSELMLKLYLTEYNDPTTRVLFLRVY